MNLQDVRNEFSENKINKRDYIEKMYGLHSVLFDYSRFIQNTNISKVEIVDDKVIMTFRNSGIQFISTSNDKRLATFETLNFGTYEADELAMQLKLIEPGFNVFDIGGNYGWYALHVAKKFPEAIIYSFEPIPRTFEYLKQNIELNAFQNIKTLNFGFSSEPGTFKFYYDPKLSVNASLQNVSGESSVEELTCRVDTLDNYCSGNKLKVDFIKCDVEGAELLAFKGGINTIKRDRPIIFSEMLRKWTAKFSYHPNDIISLFSHLGYKCFTLQRGALKPFELVNEDTAETNFFFLHSKNHAEKITLHKR